MPGADSVTDGEKNVLVPVGDVTPLCPCQNHQDLFEVPLHETNGPAVLASSINSRHVVEESFREQSQVGLSCHSAEVGMQIAESIVVSQC